MNPVLVAVNVLSPEWKFHLRLQAKYPQTPPQKTPSQTKYFEVETKAWKPLPYMAQVLEETESCFSAEYVGNYLYVAAAVATKNKSDKFLIYRYDTVNNSWEILHLF
ncbi:hypothetical protein OS493_039913 [Desmophyllum pertusum]|uniref:Uncharacterized protein n=1 Tax=Desmophyllum pertusum TaxID=174260 RepID=A0A9W9Y9R2_9CNID|nr:hypothetical protein OS493_039913 [Desmophyllum pertusum]